MLEKAKELKRRASALAVASRRLGAVAGIGQGKYVCEEQAVRRYKTRHQLHSPAGSTVNGTGISVKRTGFGK